MLGYILSAVSLLFAIYQWSERRKLETINRQNTWSLYHDSSVIFGGLQRLQVSFLNNKDVKSELGQLIGHAEAMMENQIRQINFNEKITSKKIDRWIKSGKLCDLTHKDFFNKFTK